jgi:hypothetical protein
MAEHDFTTSPEEQRQQFECLGDLMSRALWPIDGFVRTLLKDEEYDDLMLVMVPLLDGAKRNLDILNDVLQESFGGSIRVETTDMIEIFGLFLPDYFVKAYVPTDEEKMPRVEEQPPGPVSPKQWEGPSPAICSLIEGIRNNIESRADRLINPDPEVPLDAAAVAKIGQGIKMWAACITKDIGVRAHPKAIPGEGE